jgi:hypothetical protein
MRDRTTASTQWHRMSRRLIAAAAAVVLGALHGGPAPAAARTATPTAAATPQRTGDLGETEVTGRLVDATSGQGIADATVSFRRLGNPIGDDVGGAVTGAAGDFAFRLVLHDTDTIRLSALAVGYHYREWHFTALELRFGPALTLELEPLSGEIAITPDRGQALPCEADASVSIANLSDDQPLTISSIDAANSYSQGDYGTGFTADLDAIALPLVLQPGEQVEFTVHYSAAGQSFPSRLTVRVESSAGQGSAVPYRGEIAGCFATPTPTATPRPESTPPCAGDCDGDGRVTVAELVRGVALALGRAVAACANADLDASGAVAVNELVAAVAASLDGCSAP